MGHRQPNGRSRRRGANAAVAALGALLLLVAASGAAAPVSNPLTRGRPAREVRAIESLAALPESTRESALEVALHPVPLVSVPALLLEFQAGLAPILFSVTTPRDEAFAALGAAPGELPIALLTGLPAELMNDAVAEGSDEARMDADGGRGVSRDDPAILALNEHFAERLDSLIAPYGIATQAAYREVLSQPDVVELMTADLEVFLSLAAIYRFDPHTTWKQLTDLNEALERARVEAERAAARQASAARAQAIQAEAQQRRRRLERRHYRYWDPWHRGRAWHRYRGW